MGCAGQAPRRQQVEIGDYLGGEILGSGSNQKQMSTQRLSNNKI